MPLQRFLPGGQPKRAGGRGRGGPGGRGGRGGFGGRGGGRGGFGGRGMFEFSTLLRQRKKKEHIAFRLLQPAIQL